MSGKQVICKVCGSDNLKVCPDITVWFETFICLQCGTLRGRIQADDCNHDFTDWTVSGMVSQKLTCGVRVEQYYRRVCKLCGYVEDRSECDEW